MNKTISTYINGISGKMGQILKDQIAQDSRFILLGGSSLEKPLQMEDLTSVNLVIDFSSLAGNESLLKAVQASKKKHAVLLCTTALPQNILSQWQELAAQGHRIFLAPNTSVGILILLKQAVSVALSTKSLCVTGSA